MPTQTLTISYAPAKQSSTVKYSLTVEQRPVSSTKLTEKDLLQMLALVRSGVSARAYRQPSCEAYVLDGSAHADLETWVWPVPLEMAYSATGDLVEPGPPTSLRMERDFDLVCAMTDHLDLPFCATNVHCTWQTPCYNKFGEQVARPTITINAASLDLSSTVFGVLRIRCLAVGFAHPLHFQMAKISGDSYQAIKEIKPVFTCTWIDAEGEQQSESITIKLPACLADLLETCPDGLTKRERSVGEVTNGEPTVPVVYFSPCTGQVLALRYERP